MFLSQIHAQDHFGKVALKKINESKQKATDQSIFQSEIQPISGTEFRLIKTETDKIGMKHRTYQQYYNGVKVNFGTLKVHERNGLRQTYGGAYFNPSGVSLNPRLSVNQARNIAKSFIGSNDVFWIGEDNISKTEIPKPELLILPNRREKTMHLVYAIGLGTSKPELKMGIVYVDAQTGKAIKYKNLVSACFDASHEEDNHVHKENNSIALPLVSGTGATVYSGSQTIETTLDTDYILYDQTRANTGQAHNHGAGSRNGIVTVNFNNHDDINDYNSAFVTDFTDNNNNWTVGEMSANEDQYALDAHWGSQLVYDYWKNEHGRDSYDGNDAAIVSYVHFDTNYTNAAWVAFNTDRGFMIYGDGSGSYTPLTNLDVVSHEIGHGINNKNVDFDYELESGALDEGFADIWAAMVDNYAINNYGLLNKEVWLINEQNGGGSIRNLANPNAYGQPDTYGGTYWYDVSSCTPDGTNNDYCGVHTNSGVLNFWFYCISSGQGGTNDNGDTVLVLPIGRDKGAQIALRMQMYLTATSDFADARAASIQAAADLYGYCSAEEESVTNAWHAVGVGNTYSGNNPSVTVDVIDQTVCVDEIATFYAEADYANTMIWQNDESGSWVDLSNDTTYSGVTTNTLAITNPDESLDGIRFRLKFSNDCGTKSTTNNRYLYVKTLPDVTSVIPTGAGCSSSTDGTLTVSFNDVSNMSNLEFSIDGGSSYPHNFDDTIGSATISDLAAGDYNVWVRRGGNDCPREVGIYTVNSVPTVTASIDTTIEADISQNNGILQVSFPDEATQTNIKFSTDGGVTFPHTFDDTLATAEITGLGAGTYDVWVSFGDDSCSKSLGSFTVNEIAYTQIPDANFENALNTLTYDNYLGDNKVPTSLINTITSLNVRLENITDLTGIQGFTSLEVLYADNNDLTSIDVSSNTVLRELRLYNNYNLTSFSVANPAIIEFLTLTDCNLSGHLDLSNYTALTTLSVQNNDLSGLNMKNGNNNNIGYFHAGGNANLDCIIVDDAAYSTTNWTNNGGATFTNSNFCDYTLISDDNFEAALEALGYDDITSDGQVPTALIEVVTSLDVNTQSIADLKGIQDFTALTDLNCESNSLTSLDVSANLNLQTLNFDNNTIASLLLGANSNLDRIEGRYNSLSTLDLSQNTGITFLNLRNNNFATIDVSNNVNLQTINLHENGITSLDVTTNINLVNLFLRASNFVSIDVSQNTLLESLNLDSCNLTNLDVSNNLALRILKVVGNNITHLDVSLNTALTSIECNNNTPLTYLSVKNGNNTNVTTFEATGNSSLSCIVVDDVTYSTTNWTDIDTGTAFSVTDYCNYTLIPDLNFEATLEALGYDDITADGQVPTTLIDKLTSLNVSGQSISDLTGIADFLALMTLNCSSNTLSTLDVTTNTNLESLNFSNNTITAVDLTNNVLLESILGFENNLTTIDLSQNVVVDKIDLDTNLLTSLDVSANTLLESLDAINNSIAGIDLSNNLQLTGIYLSSNSIPSLDLSNHTLLEDVECIDCELTSLNLKNANNAAIGYFDVTINPDLNCIAVDDVAYSTTNWTNIDSTTSFTTINYCNYTLIPDVNFEAELEALGYDDISGDGQVPTQLIEVVETLDVESKSIADLTGIEDFLALKTLDAGYNSLSAINLTNNTELRQLIVRSNTITSIDLSANTLLIGFKAENSLLTSLDVSNNTDLKVLWLTNNDLITIDLTNNVSLTSFWGSGNDFITLDLSNNPALNSFRASSNSLTSLNLRNGSNTNITGGTNFQLTGNAGLGCVLVDDVTYSTTNWLGIDGSVNFSNIDCDYTLIPDANFEARLEALGYDDISNDGKVPTRLIEVVTNLNVSNQDIADLTGIEDFTALEVLVSTNNSSLTTIDVSNNTNLLTLSAFNCGLTSIDVTNNTNLQRLIVYGNAIENLDVSLNTQLVDLDLLANNLTTLEVTNNTLLQTLFVADNNLSSLDVSNNSALVELTTNNNSNLSYLNVQNGNNTNVTTFTANNNASLTCILVDDAAYSTTNWTNIDTATTSFSNIYCRYTAIPDANFEASLEALGYDDITADGQVPTALIEVVTILNVGSNSISDLTGIEDFTALEEIQCHNNAIVTLDFSSNLNLTYIRAYNNQSLTSLNVSNNTELDYLTCSSNGSRAVLTSLDLTNNPKLETLNISKTSIASIDLSQNLLLDDLTSKDTYLTSLDLSSNTVLTELDVNNNNFLSDLNVQNGNNTNVTSFKATGNSLLTCILVDDLNNDYSSWNKDVIASFSDTYCRYTTIPDANFEAALEALGYDDISGDGQVPTVLIEVLTSLDVRSQGINNLTGIEDFTALENLDCRSNLLTTLDVSANLVLEELNCFNNVTLSSINIGVKASFTTLRAHNNNIESIYLGGCPALTDLNISFNPITALDVSNNISLETLFAEETSIIQIDLSMLSNLLEVEFINCDNLSDLNIQNGANTNITDFYVTGTPLLSCVLVDDVSYSTTNWTDIDVAINFSDTYCRYTAIPDANFEAWLDTLGFDDISSDGQVPTSLIETIVSLSISNQNIADLTGIEDFAAIESFYADNNSLITADFSNNANLKVLSVTDNSLLIDLDITNNLNLEELFASSCGLTTVDLSNNPALKIVTIFDNNLTQLDVTSNLNLESILCQNNSITNLDFSLNTAITFIEVSNNALTSLNVKNENNTNVTVFNATNNSELTCILVDSETYSNANWSLGVGNTASFNEVTCTIDYQLSARVFLQGALLNPNTGEESLMRDDLRVVSLIPTTSPYADAATCVSTVFNTGGTSGTGALDDDIVDWIWVELRDQTDNTSIIASQSGLIQRDGDIVAVDGISALTFSLIDKEYYVAIKHRNHLGIMTTSTITLSTLATNVDFTDTTNQITYGTDAQTTFGMPSGVVALWAGDANGDGQLNYLGANSDIPSIRSQVFNDPDNSVFGGPPLGTYQSEGYTEADVNMDGVTVYSGGTSDILFIRDNTFNNPSNSVFGGPPLGTYLFIQQLPEGAN